MLHLQDLIPELCNATSGLSCTQDKSLDNSVENTSDIFMCLSLEKCLCPSTIDSYKVAMADALNSDSLELSLADKFLQAETEDIVDIPKLKSLAGRSNAHQSCI